MMSFGFDLAPQRRVFAAFAIYAFCLGNIFPRLPDIQRSMGVEEGALGLALIGAPVGTLIALTFATPVLERTGFRRGLLFGIPLLAVLYACSSHCSFRLGLRLDASKSWSTSKPTEQSIWSVFAS
jgi:MFS family permease